MIHEAKATRRFKSAPLSKAFGAEVLDIDLAQVVEESAPEAIAELRSVLGENLLIFFRAQTLTPQQLCTFTGYFGTVKAIRRQTNLEAGVAHVLGEPRIKVVSNVKDEGGKLTGDIPDPGELRWHQDGTYLPRPLGCSILYCRAAPDDAPSTRWVSQYQVFASFSPERQRELGALRILDYHHASPTQYLPEDSPIVNGARAIERPLVRVVPETGLPAMLLPYERDCPIRGADGELWSTERSSALLAELFAAVENYGNPCVLTLHRDDLVLWDNRATVHKRDNFDQKAERVLWLTSTEGEVPIPWSA
jgi:taurine dioxygenase